MEEKKILNNNIEWAYHYKYYSEKDRSPLFIFLSKKYSLALFRAVGVVPCVFMSLMRVPRISPDLVCVLSSFFFFSGGACSLCCT